MSKVTKVCLITATILVLIGAIIFTGVMIMFKFDFSKLGTGKYETNTYQMTESFDNISINVDVSEINFIPSNDEECKVVCYEQEKVKHSCSVENSTLVINVEDTRKWYEHISISDDTPKLAVYLPQDKYTSLSIDTSVGDITVPKEFTFDNITINGSTASVTCCASATNLINIELSTGRINLDSICTNNMSLTCTTGSINLNSVNAKGTVSTNTSTGAIKIANLDCVNFNAKTTTGAIKVENLDCVNLNTKATTGSVNLSSAIATEDFVINTTTGGVKFQNSDAANIKVKTTTGSVSGTLLSDKIFMTDTATGSVKVPKTTTGGICEISTSTGSIKIDVQ